MYFFSPPEIRLSSAYMGILNSNMKCFLFFYLIFRIRLSLLYAKTINLIYLYREIRYHTILFPFFISRWVNIQLTNKAYVFYAYYAFSTYYIFVTSFKSAQCMVKVFYSNDMLAFCTRVHILR